MKTLFTVLFALSFAGRVSAQQKQPVSSLQEDCSVTFAFTAASSGAQAPGTVTAGSTGTTPVIDNRQAGCIDWMVTYSATTTVTVLSLNFQTATDLAGLPGTWSSYPGTLTSGINPNTAVTAGGAVTEATGPKYPFVRMNMTGFTGPGTVTGKLYGWKRRPVYVTVSSGGGCAGTVGTPCVVDGPTASGSPPTTAPVLVAGQDGTNLRTLKTDSSGDVQAQLIGNTTVISGQQTVTASAVALATNTARNICVKAKAGNAAAIYIGPTGITTATGMELTAGNAYCGPVTNTNLIFVIAAAAVGDGVTWFATN